MISEKAATVTGTIGTVCFCCQMIPQIIFLYRRKDCTGFPPIFMFLWIISCIPFTCFTLISHANLVIEIQPHLFLLFCSITYAQTLYYPPYGNKSWKRVLKKIVPIALVDLACEVGFVIWLRPLYSRGVTWPALVFGVLASVLLAIGLLPPYWELAKRNGEVVGISFVFLAIDSSGAYFSLVSIILGKKDVMGIILYAIIAFMELGIFISHFIWCCRFKWLGTPRKQLDEEKAETLSNDNTLMKKSTYDSLQSNKDNSSAVNILEKLESDVDVDNLKIISSVPEMNDL